MIPDGWVLRREKDRTTWTTEHSHWQVELTRVTQFDPATGETEHKLEAELELEEWVWQFLVKKGVVDSARRVQVLEELWTGLVQMMGSLVDSLELSLEPILDGNKLLFIRRACWECVNRAMANRNDFPGTMPVAFSRRHFRLVQTNDYLISEKTDGVRYMLLLLKDHGAFLIGRKFAIHALPLRQADNSPTAAKVLVDNLARNGPTLIGELLLCVPRERRGSTDTFARWRSGATCLQEEPCLHGVRRAPLGRPPAGRQETTGAPPEDP